MSNLSRRLRKLEAGLTDRSGLIPHSATCFEYCNGWTDKLVSGEEPLGRIPLEAVDAILHGL